MMNENKPKKFNRDDSELDVLNQELGSFGLEPPKFYREDQARAHRRTQPEPKKETVKKKKVNPKLQKITNVARNTLTVQEQNARNKKRRRLKKKVRLALSIIGLVLAVAITIIVLSLTVFFKIDTITIKGSTTYDDDQIKAVLPIQKEDNLFLVDDKGAEQKLKENLPYIYSATIARKLPSKITVSVTEPEVLYFVENSDGSFTYFDDTFKALEVGILEQKEAGIKIEGMALDDAVAGQQIIVSNQEVVAGSQALINLIKSLKLTEITAVCSESDTSNYIVYDNRITIKLGDLKGIEDKTYAALTAIEKLNETNPEAAGILTSTGGKQVYFTDQK